MQVRLGQIKEPAQAVGDLPVGVASGYQRLGVGTNGQVLKSNGTTIVWASDTAGPADVRDEITGVTITGTDTALPTLSAVPSSGSIPLVFLNGILQRSGAGNDYTIAADVITWLASTGTGINIISTDIFEVQYF